MSLLKIANRAYVETATVGTGGTIILGSPVSGYQGFEGNPHIASGDTVVYGIEDGPNWEIGTADLVDNGGTFELQNRTPSESSAGGAAINLSGDAKVFGTVRQEDLHGGSDAQYSETVFVDLNGSTESNGKNPVRPTTLANALANAGQGDALMVYRAQHPAATVTQRNISIVGTAMAGASGQFPTIDSLTVNAGGIKLANLKFGNGLNIDTSDASGIGSHLSAVNTNGLTITGDQFLEGDDIKVYASGGNTTTIGGTAARYFYGSEFEAGIIANGSGLLYVQDSISGPIVATAGTLVLRDVTATVPNGTLSIGPGVVYALQNVSGFNVQIDPAAINITDANILGGMTEADAQKADKVWFEGLRTNALDLAGRLTTTEQSVSDFAANGAVAASDLDRTAVLTFNQTTADVTVTLSTPTDATPTRLMVLRNAGTADLTVEGETLAAGKFSFAYWDGSAWSVFSAASGGAVQPVVDTKTNVSGTVSLDADTYNWFNVTPSGDVTLQFGLTSQDEAKIDLVWTNADVQDGYDLANASYSSVSEDVSSGSANPHGIAFSADGTKMFVASNTGADVTEYDLGTAFDVSTATSGDNLDVSGQIANPDDVAISPDGTRLFVCGSNDVAQYDLSTANDLVSTTFAGSQTLTAQDSLPVGISFSPDGTKMFMAGATDNKIFSYSLGTAFDITTLTYDSVEFDASAQLTGLQGIDISNDGTKLFAVGLQSDAVFQYDLGTAFDLSTASYSGTTFSVSSQEGISRALRFSTDGTKMYVSGANSEIYQYDAALPAVAATLTFPAEVVWDGGSAPTLSNAGEEDWLRFDTTDGGATWFGYIERQNGVKPSLSAPPASGAQPTVNTINSASGTTSLDVDTYNWFNVKPAADVELTFDLTSQDEGKFDLVWENDEVSSINPAPSSVGYRLDLAEYANVSFSVSAQDASPQDIAFSNNGTKMFVLGVNSRSVYQYTLSSPFIVETASYDNVSFSVVGQDSNPLGLAFNDDGTKMYVIGNTSDSVHQYTLATAFDLNTASYDIVSFSVSAQEGVPQGFTLSNDGTKMYVVGSSSDRVHQYTLSTAFDLNTASYDNVSFSVVGQEETPSGLTFNDDGTKMFVVGNNSDSVYLYTLTTAFDLSTASYGSVSFGVSAQDNVPTGLTFSNDGTKMYVVGTGTDRVYQYTTGVTSGIDSATYTGASVNVTDRNTNPRGVAFNNDGTKMYVICSNFDSVNQYALSTPFSVATASYDNVTFNVSAQDISPQGIAFSSDGTKMFVMGNSSDSVHQYTLSTPFNVATASYDNVAFNVSAQDSVAVGIAFSSDGTKMFVAGDISESVHQYALSTPFSVATASYDNVAFNVSGQDDRPAEIAFNNDGTKMFVIGNDSDNVYQYSLSTAFDLSTASYDSVSISVSEQEANPSGVVFSSDDTKMFVIGSSSDSVHEYEVGTIQANINLAEYNGNSFDPTAQESIPRAVEFNNDGTKMYVAGNGTNTVFQYTLSTPFSVATASYDGASFNVSGELSPLLSLRFSNDGTKMYVTGTSSTPIHQYTLSTPFNVATASYDNVSFSVAGQETSDIGFSFSSDGTKLFVVGPNSDSVHQYTLTTAFDLNTASYDNVSFNVSGIGLTPLDVIFNSDGTKMLVLDASTDRVYQYALGTGFDLTTAGYTGFSLDVSAQGTSPYGLAFNDDETKIFVADSGPDLIFEYDLPGETTIIEKLELELPATIVWDGGSQPVLSDTGKKDWFNFQTATGGSRWLGKVVDQGF